MHGGILLVIIHEYYIYRHFKREAEPKDYDICNPEDGKRNLLRTTYKRIGNIDEAVSHYISFDYKL